MLLEGYTKGEQGAILINIMEELVRRAVDSSIQNMDMCSCEICRLNACALALNALEPRYVTTAKGALLAEIQALRMGIRPRCLSR